MLALKPPVSHTFIKEASASFHENAVMMSIDVLVGRNLDGFVLSNADGTMKASASLQGVLTAVKRNMFAAALWTAYWI